MKEGTEELVERIAEEGNSGKEEVMKRIEQKEEEYSGLISKEGAAHIVAKEEGIDLVEGKGGALDIGNIVSGMNSVTVTGKIQQIFDTREFETENGKGKVANVILADETGSVRLSLWNEEVERLIEEGKIEEGQVIEIENGYVKEDNRGNPELRLGRSGKIKKSEEEIDVESGGETQSKGRVKVEDLSPGVRGKIRGTILNVFANKPFYKTCPECGKRVEDECEEHNKSEVNLALSAVVDDGTDSIRSVFFQEQAENLIGIETEKAWEMTNEGSSMDEFSDKCDQILGKEIILEGRVQMNDFSGRPEFIVNSLEDVEPEKEAKEILASV